MGEGALPKCGAELNYHLILGPLFENAATNWALSYTCFIYSQIWLNIFLDDCHLSPLQNC